MLSKHENTFIFLVYLMINNSLPQKGLEAKIEKKILIKCEEII